MIVNEMIVMLHYFTFRSLLLGYKNIVKMATAQISKKRKFIADGVFFAKLNEVLMRELAEDGYSGVEVRVTPMRTEIIIRATRTQNVLGDISSAEEI